MRSFTFLEFIRRCFGIRVVYKLKKCMKIFRLIVHTQIRVKFLKCCIRYNLVPPHLYCLQARHLLLYNNKFKNLFNKFNNLHIAHIIRIELRDAYARLHSIRSELFKLHKSVSYELPWNIVSRFFCGQERKNERLWHSMNTEIIKKTDRLILKRNTAWRSKIAPICFSINKDNKQKDVTISQSEFGTPSKIDDIQEKWLVNLSDREIPKEVRLLLQLGDRFNLPLTNKKASSFEVIKCVEKNIDRQNEYIQNAVRNDTIPLIYDMNKYRDKDHIDKKLKSWSSITNKFINKNEDIIFTRADKGNTTVVLNRGEYITQMTDLLSDENTYERVNKDPSRKVTESLRSLLSRWKKKGYINDYIYRGLNKTDGLLPRAYGVPKIHKQGYPLRIIISSIDSTLYSLANYLHNIIQKSLSCSKSYVKNSFDLVEKLKHTEVEVGYQLASLDVISLFTNIPIDMANDSLEKRWRLISNNTQIPQEEFLNAINLVLNSTFFSFNNNYYKQIFGTPMGSPLSPIIADLVMQDLEELAIRKLPCAITLYYRYVDDVLFMAKASDFEIILETFNSIHERLKFTIEKSVNNYINFLNVNITVKENRFRFDVYYKPTFSHRYLNFCSHHPLIHKKGVIIGLVDKVMRLSESELHHQNLKFIISILLDNGYPLDLIFTTIKNRLRFYLHNNKTRSKNKENNNKKYFPIPYIKCISEKFVSILRKHDFIATFFCNNNLQKFIKSGKDILDPLNQCGVVYKISCQDCEASYVGQTKRQLGTRIKEHRSDINKKTGSPSVISLHKLDNDHDFKWSNVEILDKESSYNKRLISEMIHIKRQNHSLNKQNDTELFPDSYLTVLNLFPSP